jgi:hypothetical protein
MKMHGKAPGPFIDHWATRDIDLLGHLGATYQQVTNDGEDRGASS